MRPLAPDEPVGVVALSGPVPGDGLDAGLGALVATGHPVVVAPNIFETSASGYLAGDDAARLAGLSWVLDQKARVIIAARGGYGVSRLLEKLPWERLTEEQVTLVGFSDLTAVVNPLAARGGTVQVHGPMAAVDVWRSRPGSRLFRLLHGELIGKRLFRFGRENVVRSGRVAGRAVGGNLTVLCSLLGTPFEPDWEDAVLFLEEVGEPLYRLDRLLTHLRISSRLSRVKALIGGHLRGCRPVGDRDRAWRELLAEAAPPGAPVVTGLAFGHGAMNLAFPIGATLEVDTGAGEILWRG